MTDPTICTSYRWRPAPDVVAYGYTAAAAARPAIEDLRNSEGWLPTASITQALTVLSGGFVHWTRTRNADEPLLVSQNPIGPAHLRAALTLWERVVRVHRGLAPAVRPLGELVDPDPGPLDAFSHLRRRAGAVPEAPDWVFRAATWDVARKLHGQRLDVDSRRLELRADSTATLFAWSDPIINGEDRATYRIEIVPITVPGVSDLVISLQPHISQNPTFIGACDHLTVELPQTDLLLDLAINHRRTSKGEWRTAYADCSAEVMDACQLHGLPALDQDVLVKQRDTIRGRGRHPQSRFAVGTGVGSRFQHHLAVQAGSLLDSPPIELSVVPKMTLPAVRKRLDPAGMAATARANGQALRVLCLYDRPATRARMARALMAQLDLSGLPDRDHEPWTGLLAAAQPIEVHFRQDPTLLRPGDMEARSKRFERLSALMTDGPGCIVVALCETEMPEGRDRKATVIDPKPQLRRLFARHGVVSQFLTSASASQDEHKDYAALGAVADVCQSAGLLDGRYDDLTSRIGWHDGGWLVGVHWRKLRRPRTESALAIAALELSVPARAFGWLPQTGWTPLATAMARFQSGRVEGSGRRRGLEHKELVTAVHAAIAQLPRAPATPVVIFAGPGQRRVWPALTNRHLGHGLAPGEKPDTSALPDVSVVRVTVDQGELVNPAGRADPAVESRDAPTGLTTRLHSLEGDHDARSWYLVHKSRHASRLGAPEARRDRHSLIAEDPYRHQRQNWHALTVTEFVVVRSAPGQDAAQLARLGAELCQRAPSWDGRLTRPTPLHLAFRMLNEHPDWIGDDAAWSD